MNRDELQRLLRQKPFQPFRIHVKDGRVYEVHWRMNLLTDSFIKIGIPDDTRPEFCDHAEFVWLKDIARVELLSTTPPVTS